VVVFTEAPDFLSNLVYIGSQQNKTWGKTSASQTVSKDVITEASSKDNFTHQVVLDCAIIGNLFMKLKQVCRDLKKNAYFD
jgi:hypothetical protein